MNNSVFTARPGDQVYIMDVDMYGYLGRDFHPQKYHNGRYATVTQVELGHSEEGDEIIYHAVTSTGQRLELMGHEIKLDDDMYADDEFPGYCSL